MIKLKYSLVLPMVAIVLLMSAAQAPFLFSSKICNPPNGVMQPSCTDFKLWVQNQSQYPDHDEMNHGLGLIPAPVDLTSMPSKNVTNTMKSRFIVPASKKITSFKFF
jgi:hypothetical protein